jgi:soluble lytic murein transglycosylase
MHSRWRSKKKIFFLGLAFGFTFTSTLVLWLGSVFWDKEIYEADQSAHLGAVNTTKPIVALKPIETERLARQLNITSSDEALRYAQVFADRIASGFLPSGWGERCRKEYHPIVCLSLDEYFETFEKNRKERASSIPSRSHIEFKDSTILSLQKEDLSRLLSLVTKRKAEELKRWSKLALKHEACPRNMSLALARMWEQNMDDPESSKLLTKLDAHGSHCLKDDDKNAEYLFMRMGLLQYAFGDKTKALDYLERASYATTKREPYRVNFWRATLLEEMGERDRANSIRELIFQDHPLSWQSIVSHHRLGRDPMLSIRMRESFRDRYFSGKTDLDRRIAWFYLLARLEGAEFATQKYFEQLLTQLDASVPRGTYQHMARVLDNIGQHRLQILALHRMFTVHPASVNGESLRMFFPKPFFEQIDASSPHLDTALLLGLVRQESGFDPKARSSANARGLLQVLPKTAREIIRRNPAEKLYDSDTNIQIGSAYLMRLLNYFGGSVEKSLAAYNAGMGRVRSWERQFGVHATDIQLFMDLLPYRETREYVPSILRNAYWYHRLFPELGLALGDGVKTSELLKELLFPSGTQQ